MTPGKIAKRVVSDRLDWVDRFHLTDLEQLAAAYRKWLREHPDRLDEQL